MSELAEVREHVPAFPAKRSGLKRRARPAETIIQALVFFSGFFSVFTTIGIVYELGKESLLFFQMPFIYVGAGNGRLFCLDAETGTPRWTFSAASVINSAPLVTANAVVVGSLDRTLYVLDRLSGTEIWRFEVPGRVRISTVLWRGFLIVASENRDVIVLVPDEHSTP